MVLDIPYHLLCKSRMPHSFPEPTPIHWPSIPKSSELDSLKAQLIWSDPMDSYQVGYLMLSPWLLVWTNKPGFGLKEEEGPRLGRTQSG